MYQLLKPKRILQTMATSSSDDITSQQVSDSGFIIFSRNNFDAMGRRRRPLAARSAAQRREAPPRPTARPKILISSKPSNTDQEKHRCTLHGTRSIRVDGNNPQG